MYVSGLAAELRSQGAEVVVATPSHDGVGGDYDFQGVRVRTYPVNARPDADELSGKKPHAGIDVFERLLAEERPDVYHQHSWSRGLGAFHLRAARGLGLKTVLTVHTPNTNCLRGTMMRFGRTACDGRIETIRCAACWSQQRGAPRVLSEVLARTPPGLARLAARTAPGARIGTALAAPELVMQRKKDFARMTADADRLVAVSHWLERAMLANGAPVEKVLLSRQGVDADLLEALRRPASRDRSGVFRLGFLGRWHPTKGIDVVIGAVRAAPAHIPIALIIYGLPSSSEEGAYEAEQRALAAGDGRIRIEPAACRADLPEVLLGLDALAVPSLWLETGPLVVLEAQASGLPILGSAAGGIAELVKPGRGGRLLPPGDVAAWSAAIMDMAADVDAVRAARTPEPVRTMSEAAADMAALYRSLVPA